MASEPRNSCKELERKKLFNQKQKQAYYYNHRIRYSRRGRHSESKAMRSQPERVIKNCND